MKWKLFFGSVLFLFSALGVWAQNAPSSFSSDTSKINELLRQSKEKINQDPAVAVSMANEAKLWSEKIGYEKGVATALKNTGIAYYVQGQPDEALLKWQEALRIFEGAQDNIGVADLLGNIGIFYYNRGDETKALDHYLRSLKIAESIGYKKAQVSALNNIGGIYYFKTATYDKALKYYLMALPLCQELGDQNILGAISVNVGNIYLKQNEALLDKGDSTGYKAKQEETLKKATAYFNQALKAYASNPVNIPNAYIGLGDVYMQQKNFDLALKNYQQALKLANQTGNKLNVVRSQTGIASLYFEQKDYRQAVYHYGEAEKAAAEVDAALELEVLYQQSAIAYGKLGDYQKAFAYQQLFSGVKDSLYNAETDKRIATLQFDFDLQKKQNEINLLTKDKSIQDLQLKRQKTFRIALFFVLGLFLIVAFVLYRNYRIKAKANMLLDRKNMEIERLLLNILPAEVAHELQTTGKATPRNYDAVSVMFTDFKGFTTLADKMSPQELVEELGACFMAFDHIIEKHGLEKIKTIGDAYMCAGGIPTPTDDHVFRVVRASLEIQEYVAQNNQQRRQRGLSPWDIRIGIHVGPVVAGVVGKKKYAYDIWGTTVNVASRMESSGMPGHVNISAATYELIKEKYACVYRGKVQAKNIGEIDMYLIDHEIEKAPALPMMEEVVKKEEVAVEKPASLLQ